MKPKVIAIIAVIAAIILGIVFWKGGSKPATGMVTVRYGITPYQDSALPVVAERLGWYKEAGINFVLVPATWGDVVNTISGNAIDVAIYNFNSFQPPYANASKGNSKPVFYCPLYLFKGQAIMIKTNSGMEAFREMPGESKERREERIAKAAQQLKGKRIAITKGTELEQIVLTALKKAGLTEKDVTLTHAAPADCLSAFLAGNMDAFAAGLTERVTARRQGATELLVTADVMLPVVDGIITSEEFATKNPEIMDRLVGIWFRTIRFMEEDLSTNSAHILGYLSKAASTRYSPEEYAVAWTFNVFPRDAKEADKLFNDPASSAYWKTAWDANNDFLKQQKEPQAPAPYSAYWGEKTLQRLAKP